MLKDNKNVLINIRDLVIEFRNKGRKFEAVKSVSFDIYRKEIFGLVGESGSGKTTIGRAIAGVQPLKDGSIYLDDQIIAGKPTSIYTINKDINKKIQLLDSKYSISSNYVNKTILNLKTVYEKFKDNPEGLKEANLAKEFGYSSISLAHQLTRENLKFINDIIKGFNRINQFTYGIHEFVPEISEKLEEAIILKSDDTKNIVEKLKDKISLDFFDIDEIKKAVRSLIKSKDTTSFLKVIEMSFKKLDLIKTNEDRIIRRIKIAHKLAKQNFDLSAPSKHKDRILKKYHDLLYVSKSTFLKAYETTKKNNIQPSKEANKQVKELLNDKESKELIDKYIIKHDLVLEYYKWQNKEYPLTDREIETIKELIEFLKLPSIDELVNNSYLFGTPTKAQKWENRKNVQMIFQDPGSSLNERMSVEEVISEGIDNFPQLYKSEEAKMLYVKEHNEQHPDNQITIDQIENISDVKKHIILKLIRSVGLLPEHLSRYPHEFSGGQKQRIGIARSLAIKPKIIIADEPISALDVSIRAQVLNLFQQFKEEYNLTYLFVTHDLSVVKFIADRIAVIYHGKIVEMAEAEELFKNPLHAYTKSLLSAIPVPDPKYNFGQNLIEYKPEEEHYDYIFDTPDFVEISKDHFVLANNREFKNIKKTLKK
ncbi:MULTISPECIES: oligopeptide ABC transporter ATP-binding protein OppF [Mesoplasma]|uniref:ABC transporter ATP-binding protein n=1 Tax=Mesoplasma florum TaxID=2151 RepID=A0A2R3P6Y9_MESFO|nr:MULTISPECIES: oligopeptide ABC transporter ATP-binding protein OppF [Mesoplasma]AVN64235.1 ABC transporter ATP-binding protein [Mesoplasma florum]